MENLKHSNELLEAIANGTAFDKETGLIWEHWLITINEQIVKNNVALANVSNSVECPECIKKIEQEELDMFGGLCENCTTDC